MAIIPSPFSVALGACVIGVGITGLCLMPYMGGSSQKTMCLLLHALPVLAVLLFGSRSGCQWGWGNVVLTAAAGSLYVAASEGGADLYYGQQWKLGATAVLCAGGYVLLRCYTGEESRQA